MTEDEKQDLHNYFKTTPIMRKLSNRDRDKKSIQSTHEAVRAKTTVIKFNLLMDLSVEDQVLLALS
jgi:hypothetical protein